MSCIADAPQAVDSNEYLEQMQIEIELAVHHEKARDAGAAAAWLVAAVLVQYLGLLAERWYFFAQARHPQTLYYQVVS